MDIPVNPSPPQIMHIDLNACFAMTEQQANPLLRGRPVGVTNRLGNDHAIIIAPSYEAKRLGVRCGTSVAQARRLAPGIIILETDPPKYRYVHQVIKQIFTDYAPQVTMKSIDEGVLNFHGTSLNLPDIGHEIKSRVREELGDWMTVNVGIGSNSFLAKLAAGLHKPDGLDVIDATNLEGIYLLSRLTDLPGINYRYRTRLMMAGIHNPYQLLHTPEHILTHQVFHSINGRHWYLRIRGYEVDDYATQMRQVGKQYVLHRRTADPEELAAVLQNLCYHTSRRLAKYHLAARGLRLSIHYTQAPSQKLSCLSPTPFYTLPDLYQKTLCLFRQSPPGLTITQFAVTTHRLAPIPSHQPALYDTILQHDQRLEQALRQINDRYGEHTLVPARMLGGRNAPNTVALKIPEKIPFGSTRYL